MELHIRTRRDYRPDPDVDPIRAVFFCVQIDSLEGKKQEKGMIIVDETNASKHDESGKISVLLYNVSHKNGYRKHNKTLKLVYTKRLVVPPEIFWSSLISTAIGRLGCQPLPKKVS